jgi:hypothetical protein
VSEAPKPELDLRTAGVVAEIWSERERQIAVEGWTAAHDDEHSHGFLALAAASYTLASRWNRAHRASGAIPQIWPWDKAWWKPKSPRRDLIRAAALIVAEIERLDRKAATS